MDRIIRNSWDIPHPLQERAPCARNTRRCTDSFGAPMRSAIAAKGRSYKKNRRRRRMDRKYVGWADKPSVFRRRRGQDEGRV
ncbi:MAG TPA: hypothetical protein VFG55_05595, partial [Rhodanobacteraceae bacterium]|nr:hypothetical protein [Rhodanobacteraceae bacterium]